MADHSIKKPGAKNPDDIFVAPTITREPMSRQIVLGGKLVLRITATGTPLPNYQWYLNGKKISGANSDRLVINKTRRDHVGAYTCEAKNFVGKAVSRAAMVSFLIEKIPELVIEPNVASVPVGKPFKFRIAAPKPEVLKRFKVQWTFNGKRISGATGPELQFTQVKKKYEGEYKVIMLIGGDIHASNCVKLLALPAEEAAQIEPALTKEKTALIAMPPKEAFFFDPMEEESALLEIPQQEAEPEIQDMIQEFSPPDLPGTPDDILDISTIESVIEPEPAPEAVPELESAPDSGTGPEIAVLQDFTAKEEKSRLLEKKKNALQKLLGKWKQPKKDPQAA